MKFTKFVPCLKVISVLSLMCCFALSATAVNYYPAEVGNTWVFLSTDGGERRAYTLEAPENTDVEGLIKLKITNEVIGTDVTATDTYFITVENDGSLLLHQSATDQGAFGIAEVTYDPPVTFFPAELPLGRTWQILSETELKIVGAVTSTSTITVVAIEDVETSAGVFEDCIKLEIKQRDVSALTVLRKTSYQWLAPDVGPVKFLSSQDLTYELQRYNLVLPTETEKTPTTEEGPIVEETPPVEEATAEMLTGETATEEATVSESPLAFDLTLKPGLNMISIPLMPAVPYTAKSLTGRVGATVVIQLDAKTEKLIAYTVADNDDGFSIEGGKGYIVNTPKGGTVKFTGSAWDNQSDSKEPVVEAAPAGPALFTFKSAWAFIVRSDIHGMKTRTAYTLVAENLRTGTIATSHITPDVRRSSAVWADLNRKSVVEVGDKLEVALYNARGQVVSGPFQRTVSTTDILNAFLSLQLNVGDVRPKDTILAQNYPNPFNPETWIPYQLATDSDVTITIYNTQGIIVRRLPIGFQYAGFYTNRSRAAYWDGRNNVGERVASGIYFYQLQTDNASFLEKMLIRK